MFNDSIWEMTEDDGTLPSMEECLLGDFLSYRTIGCVQVEGG